MKKIILLSLFATLLFLPKSTFAHVMQTDGSISVEMHIEPKDDPVAGEQSTLLFEIEDEQQKFNPSQCTCTITISQKDGKQFTQSLYEKSNVNVKNPSLPYVFPKKGIYTIQIKGVPTQPNTFQPFNTTFITTVNTETSKNLISNIISSNYFILSVSILIMVIGVILAKLLKK